MPSSSSTIVRVVLELQLEDAKALSNVLDRVVDYPDDSAEQSVIDLVLDLLP